MNAPSDPGGVPNKVPHAVPVLKGEFVNRTDELNQVCELLDPTADSVRIALQPGISEALQRLTGALPRLRQWREDRIDALIAEHELSGEPIFIAGAVWNQGEFHSRFDQVVLLSASLPVMLERIANRDTDSFGKSAEERDRIIADTTDVEPLLRSSATLEINTEKPLAEVVDQLAALAGPPPRR
ncbi:hypothetical protein [Saccharopolyspora sp. NPDC002376]